MNIYLFSLLIIAAVAISMGYSVYYRSRSEPVNRIFFVYALSGAFLSFVNFMFAGAGDPLAALFWLRAWFLWPLIPVILFLFILSVTGNYNTFNKLLFILSMLLYIYVSIQYLTNKLMIGLVVKTSIGWYHKAPSYWVYYLSAAYTLILFFYASLIVVKAYNLSTQREKRQQYILILISVLIPIIASSINYVVLAAYKVGIPSLYIYSFFLGLLFIRIAITKFQLFPFVSSVEIMPSSLNEAMILADSKGRIVFINKKMSEISGYSQKELAAKPLVSFFKEGLAPDLNFNEGAALITRDKRKVQLIFFKTTVANPRSNFSGSLYLFRKAEKIVQLHTNLVRQTELLQTIINAFPYPFLIINIKDYTLDTINSAARQLSSEAQKTCYALSHKFNEPCSSLEHPCPMAEVLRTGKGVIVEHVHRAADGTALDVEVHAYPLFDKNGKIGRMIEYHFDISKRKLVMKELIKAKEKAEESDIAKTRFLGSMSHELRTPLNSIQGFSDLLLMTGDNLTGEQHQFLSLISKSSRELTDIITSILNYVDMEDGNHRGDESTADADILVNFTFLRICKECIKPFEEELKNKKLSTKFDFDKGAELLILNTNTGKLRIILSNLISNGVKFSNKGGVIYLEAKIKEESLYFSIKNTGVKLDYTNVEKIFEPFFQKSMGYINKTPGIGMGLTLVRQALEALDGNIWVESKAEDSFTKFAFKLPITSLR